MEACLRHLGFQESEETIESISNELSEVTRFSPNEPRLYFYVREPKASGIYENHAQGFAKKTEFMSELFDGMVCVDGLTDFEMKFGDTFTCQVGPEFALKTVKFLR